MGWNCYTDYWFRPFSSSNKDIEHSIAFILPTKIAPFETVVVSKSYNLQDDGEVTQGSELQARQAILPNQIIAKWKFCLYTDFRMEFFIFPVFVGRTLYAVLASKINAVSNHLR